MFIMMNAARLGVGLQGLAQGEVAYQNAAAYARDRRQSRALKESEREPGAKADPIIVHPDVRRMLMEARAWNEAGRAFVLWGALAGRPRPPLTRRGRAATGRRSARAVDPGDQRLSDRQRLCRRSPRQQVLGGHGYIREHGIEQFVRDAGSPRFTKAPTVSRRWISLAASFRGKVGEQSAPSSTCSARTSSRRKPRAILPESRPPRAGSGRSSGLNDVARSKWHSRSRQRRGRGLAYMELMGLVSLGGCG